MKLELNFHLKNNLYFKKKINMYQKITKHEQNMSKK